METLVKSLTVSGHKINIYGVKEDENQKEYDFYDIFLEEEKQQHCLTESEPFYSMPTKKQIAELIAEFMLDN